jgi:hypothetical protein
MTAEFVVLLVVISTIINQVIKNRAESDESL